MENSMVNQFRHLLLNESVSLDEMISLKNGFYTDGEFTKKTLSGFVLTVYNELFSGLDIQRKLDRIAYLYDFASQPDLEFAFQEFDSRTLVFNETSKEHLYDIFGNSDKETGFVLDKLPIDLFFIDLHDEKRNSLAKKLSELFTTSSEYTIKTGSWIIMLAFAIDASK